MLDVSYEVAKVLFGIRFCGALVKGLIYGRKGFFDLWMGSCLGGL